MIHSQWRIGFYQEALAAGSSEALRQQRGIARALDPTGTIAEHAGGSGREVIRPLYPPDDERSNKIIRQCVDHKIQTDKRRWFNSWFLAADIAAFNPRGDFPFLKRGGIEIWRSLSLHYSNTYAKRKDDAKMSIVGLLRLAFRDKIRALNADWNQSHTYLEEGIKTALK